MATAFSKASRNTQGGRGPAGEPPGSLPKVQSRLPAGCIAMARAVPTYRASPPRTIPECGESTERITRYDELERH